MRFTGQYSGGSSVRRKLRRVEQDVIKQVTDTIDEASKMLLGEAIARVPVKSGTLRDSLSIKKSRDGLSAKVGVIGRAKAKRAFYAKWVEYGTKNAPAKPFIGPAKAIVRQHYFRMLRQAVYRALRGYRSHQEYAATGGTERMVRNLGATLKD